VNRDAPARVRIAVQSLECEAIIGNGVLDEAGTYLRGIFSGRKKLFVITIANVRRRWGKQLMRSLSSAELDARMLEIPDGENQKKLGTVEALAEKLAGLRADRGSAVIAFGGGVVGDIAGLLASVYMRGVDFVQIPTTVLAQVDAAIGGKTGANLRAGKNLVGTFHQPRAVLIDPTVLSTLPERQFRSGLYEVLKAGIIGNEGLVDFLESVHLKQLREDSAELNWLISEAVRLKAEIVSKDEKESGPRRTLNFGHTVGHALEAACGYRRLLHGEAVAWGMIAAADIAVAVGTLGRDAAERITNAVLQIGPLPPINVGSATVFRFLGVDKKSRDGSLYFVLPRAIGQVEITNAVPIEAIEKAVQKVKRLSQTGARRSARHGRA